MIRLAFLIPNKEIIIIEVDNKIVKWYDRIWQNGLQILPMLESNVQTMLNSKNVNMKRYAEQIIQSNQGKEFEEYLNCKDDSEIIELIRRDMSSKGLKEVKQ